MQRSIIVDKIRKTTITRCIAGLDGGIGKKYGMYQLYPGSQVIIDGQIRDRAIWVMDLYSSGPAALKYLKDGARIWKNSLVAIASKQYVSGKIPSCVSLSVNYRFLSPFSDDYSLWWIIIADEYIERTGDLDFRNYFIGVVKKALVYHLARVNKHGIYTSSYINYDWNWTILRPKIAAYTNAIFYRVLQIVSKYSLVHSPTDFNAFKIKYSKLFWNPKLDAFVDTGSQTINLHTNAAAILFHLADENQQTKILGTLEKFNTPYGPRSYIGKSPFSPFGWHDNIICPLPAYLYAKALLSCNRNAEAKEVVTATILAGFTIAQKYGGDCVPEFWKDNGDLGYAPATNSLRFFTVSLCHSWGAFGDVTV